MVETTGSLERLSSSSTLTSNLSSNNKIFENFLSKNRIESQNNADNSSPKNSSTLSLNNIILVKNSNDDDITQNNSSIASTNTSASVVHSLPDLKNSLLFDSEGGSEELNDDEDDDDDEENEVAILSTSSSSKEVDLIIPTTTTNNNNNNKFEFEMSGESSSSSSLDNNNAEANILYSNNDMTVIIDRNDEFINGGESSRRETFTNDAEEEPTTEDMKSKSLSYSLSNDKLSNQSDPVVDIIAEEDEENENAIINRSPTQLNKIKKSLFLSNSGKSTISSTNSFSLACEVASLSSLTSNYSQFDFEKTSSDNKTSSSSSSTTPTPSTTTTTTTMSPSKSGGGLTSSFSFFSNSLFGNKKQQKELISSTLATEEKSVKLVVGNNNKLLPPVTPTTRKFDLITNKLLNFKPSTNKNSFNLNANTNNNNNNNYNNDNKFTSTSSDSSSNNNNNPSSSVSSSSICELSHNSNNNSDNVSIKSNHSNNNLCSILADLQVPNSVLIFENRPSNLPAKSKDEALKHKQEYEKMVEIAKKKEQKEKELKLKKYEQQIKKEDFMANSLKVWNSEILANWNEQKSLKRTHQLWWHGLPPSIRGKVWQLAIGNELNLTKESFYLYERKAKECELSSSVEMIKLDVSRTFPHLCFFQKNGPYHEALHGVLGAYACYNTKIGYVQGMSFLTAILLLNMEAPDAFICLSNLLNTKYLLACFCMDQAKMNRYFKAHQILLEHNMPKLYRHFEEQKVKPDLYLIDWIFTLFSKSLPLDVVSRVWDVFFRDHEEFLFRTALGILNLYKETLLQMDFIHIVQLLTKLPENINSTHLFKSIEQISTSIDDTYFTFEHLIGKIADSS